MTLAAFRKARHIPAPGVSMIRVLSRQFSLNATDMRVLGEITARAQCRDGEKEKAKAADSD
jgi:hypothetical protein